MNTHHKILNIIFHDYQEKGKLKEAIDVFLDILDLEPTNYMAMYLLGRIYYETDNYDLVIKYCKNVVQFMPNCAEAYNLLGIAFREKGQFKDAIACQNKALQFNPQLPQAYIELARAFQEKGQIDEALSCFQKSLQCITYDASNTLNFYTNKERDAMLFVPYKCGYSSLEYHVRTGEIDKGDKGDWGRYYKVLLVRCPQCCPVKKQPDT